ncbi:MAG: hypothetical protein V1915_03895 [Candidatus Bathyarchaeota archaeon]
MDYATLYEMWKREKENSDLQLLDKSFYDELSEHIRVHREELLMLDEKTLRAKLAREASHRTEKLFTDLIWIRYRKICEVIFCGKHIPMDLLTAQEESIYKDISLVFERMKRLEKDIIAGHAPKSTESKDIKKRKRTLLVRILQSIPAIVGTNTNIYGPFKAEDIASLPLENAESLIKRGIAVKVEPE